MKGGTRKKLVNTIGIAILLPNNVRVRTATGEVDDLSDQDAKTQSDILIGKDIINLCDFVVSNFKGRTSFSFRHPSLRIY